MKVGKRLMKRKLSTGIIVLSIATILLLSTVSCRENNNQVSDSEPTAKLDGSQWSLTSINGSELVEGSYISLYFRKGTIWGSAGCNIYGAKYSTEAPNILAFSELASTDIGGPENIIHQEEAYLKSLHDAAFYHVEGKYLEIYNAANQKSLIFERQPEYPMNPADLVGTKWQLVSLNGDYIIKGLSITLTFDSGSVASGQAGCFRYTLPYEASGDDIRWGISSSRVGELPQELESQALRYTDIIIWAANYRLTKGQLEIFTARGETLIFKPS